MNKSVDGANSRPGRNVDLMAAAAVAAIGAAFVTQLGGIKNSLDKMFPAFVLSVLGMLTLLLLVKAVARPDRRPVFTEARPRLALLFLALGVVWVAIIPAVGFFPAAYLLLTLCVLTLDDAPRGRGLGRELARRLAVTLLVNAAMLAFVYVVFVRFLGIRFPGGA